jgi:uncharacterized linocin/CFP29 family protein
MLFGVQSDVTGRRVMRVKGMGGAGPGRSHVAGRRVMKVKGMGGTRPGRSHVTGRRVMEVKGMGGAGPQRSNVTGRRMGGTRPPISEKQGWALDVLPVHGRRMHEVEINFMALRATEGKIARDGMVERGRN